MYRYTKPISLKLDNQNIGPSSEYAGAARAFLGHMVGLFGDDLVGCKQTRRLSDGSTITVHIPAEGMIPIVSIRRPVNTVVTPVVVPGKVCYMGIVATPTSDDAPYGWGIPANESVNTPPLGEPITYAESLIPYGSEGAEKVELIFPSISEPEEELPVIEYNHLYPDDSTTWDFHNTYISEAGKVYVWGGQSCLVASGNKLAATRYSTSGVGRGIYSCGILLTKVPSGYKVYGVCTFNGHLYVALSKLDSELTVLRRTLKDSYRGDLGYEEVYDEETEPDGWEILINYTLPTIVDDISGTSYAMQMYGVAAGSLTTGEMAVCVGRGGSRLSITDPAGYVQITLGDTVSSSYIGLSSYPANTVETVQTRTTIYDDIPYTVEYGDFSAFCPGSNKKTHRKVNTSYAITSASTSTLPGDLEVVGIVEYMSDVLSVNSFKMGQLGADPSSTWSNELNYEDTGYYRTPLTPGWVSCSGDIGLMAGRGSHSRDGSYVSLDLPNQTLPIRTLSPWNSSHSFSGEDSQHWVGFDFDVVTGSGSYTDTDRVYTKIDAVDLRTGALILTERTENYNNTYTRNTYAYWLSIGGGGDSSILQSTGPNPHVFYSDSSIGFITNTGPHGVAGIDEYLDHDPDWEDLPPGGVDLRHPEEFLPSQAFFDNRPDEGVDQYSFTSTTKSKLTNLGSFFGLVYSVHNSTSLFGTGSPVIDHDGDVFISRTGFNYVDLGYSKFDVVDVSSTTFNFYSRYISSGVDTAVGIVGNKPIYKNIKLI